MKNCLEKTLPARKVLLLVTRDNWSLASLCMGGHNYPVEFDKAVAAD